LNQFPGCQLVAFFHVWALMNRGMILKNAIVNKIAAINLSNI